MYAVGHSSTLFIPPSWIGLHCRGAMKDHAVNAISTGGGGAESPGV